MGTRTPGSPLSILSLLNRTTQPTTHHIDLVIGSGPFANNGLLFLSQTEALPPLATHATAFASNLPSTSVLFRISHGPLPFDNVPTY